MENLLKLTNKSPEFYPLMGPYLSRREIAKELGYPVWDDDEKQWAVSLVKGRVAGFCGLRKEGSAFIVTSSYVMPEHRRAGIYKRMLDAILEDIPRPALVKVTANPLSAPILKKSQFKVIRETKNFTMMEREIK